MSRQAEEAYERSRKAHDEECQRVLVLGAKVYRARWDRIEEGKVRRLDRVRFDSDGREVEDLTGPYTRYVACFGSDWEGQTYQWKWFHRIDDAKRELAKQLRDRAKDKRQEADRWDALAATYESALAESIESP